jgi:hypothetical protein
MIVLLIPSQPAGRDATDDPRRGGEGLERIWKGNLRPFVGGPFVVGVMLSGGCSTVSGGSGNCAYWLGGPVKVSDSSKIFRSG